MSGGATIASEIERYLRTGRTDFHHRAWPSSSFFERALQAHDDLRGALVAEVLRRAEGVEVPDLPIPDETATLTRRLVEPMIHGLFPRAEQDAVLALVERSVVFLGPANIEAVLRKESFDHAAWSLANLYLGSLGVDLLGPDAPAIVGVSQETTCFVSPAYFQAKSPFADYVVHEVARVFHNCKRRTAGLAHSRRREWLLDIEFGMRETFAYSCEAYSCVVRRAQRFGDRRVLAAEFAAQFGTGDERVDPAEVGDIVREAAERRDARQEPKRRVCAKRERPEGRGRGRPPHPRKAILARCAPPPRPRRVGGSS